LIDRHGKRRPDHSCDRGDIANEIELEIVVEGRVDRIICTGYEKRITVGQSAYDRLGADIAAKARPVLDDEGLSEPLRQPLTDQTRGDVDPLLSGMIFSS
jgi:hypothetical protein